MGEPDNPRLAGMAMAHAIRNLGRPGIASMAIAAVDVALWDLKARLLDLPLLTLLGAVRDAAPVYGSGGFTSYPIKRLQEQLGGWAEQGIPRVKMKIGAHPEDDLSRVRAAREAIWPDALLFVDANGAYSRKQALAQAEAFRDEGVVWFEEPVSADDLEGLRLIRDRAPAGWTSRRASMATTSTTSGACWRPSGGRAAGRWLALRGHHRVPARGDARRGASPGASRPTARPRCMPLRAALATAQPHRVFPRPRRVSSICCLTAR